MKNNENFEVIDPQQQENKENRNPLRDGILAVLVIIAGVGINLGGWDAVGTKLPTSEIKLEEVLKKQFSIDLLDKEYIEEREKSQNQIKIIMKNVLIVDDTPENLDAAKKFFAKVKSFNFMFAENLEQALKLLPDADMVISDRSFPYNETTKNIWNGMLDEGKESLDEDDLDYYQNYIKTNGHYLTLLCASKNIPVILASQHGTDGPLVIRNIDNVKDNELLSSLLEDFLTNPHVLNIEKLKYFMWEDSNFLLGPHPEPLNKIKKNTQDGWSYIWTLMLRKI